MGQRLIDADALRREIDCCDFDSQTDKLTICQQISEAPTVDAVLVVRCRECRRVDGFGGVGIEPDEVGICAVTRMCVNPDDFCSYGVWREADHDGKEN